MTWIEQLAEKRDSVGSNAAIAVTWSGFSGPAVTKAAAKRVELRTVESVSAVDVAHWLSIETVTVRLDTFAIKHVDVTFRLGR